MLIATPPRAPWRLLSAVGLLTLLPTAVVAWLLLLSAESSSRCITYGEECSPNRDLLMAAAWWTFLTSAAAGMLALVLPGRLKLTKYVRPASTAVQLLAQAAMFIAIIASV